MNNKTQPTPVTPEQKFPPLPEHDVEEWSESGITLRYVGWSEEKVKAYAEDVRKQALEDAIANAVKITELEAQLADAQKDAWIPVSERLPETTIPALLILNSNGYIDTDWFCHLRKDFSYYEGRVTHWMPLPKPPVMQPKEQS